MSPETIARVDDFAKALSKPWAPARRSDAVRVLLEIAIAEIDREGIGVLPQVHDGGTSKVPPNPPKRPKRKKR